MKAKRFISAAAGLLLLLAAGVASAVPTTPTLTLYDPGAGVTVVVQDGILNDLNPLAGFVTYIGAVGSWDINVTTGISQPYGGGIPFMDLNSVDTSLFGGGTLIITLSDYITKAWDAPGGSMAAGGTTSLAGSRVTFETLVNHVVQGTLDFNLPQGGPFSGSSTFAYAPLGNELVELTASIFHPDAFVGVTSFDFQLTPVPEPSTVLLLGSACMLFALYSKRRSCRQS